MNRNTLKAAAVLVIIILVQGLGNTYLGIY